MSETPTRDHRERWLSAYLRLPADGELYGAACDRLLLEAVAPALDAWRRDGLADAFFFVRYESREHGRHLRLRLRPSEPSLRDAVGELAARSDLVADIAWVPFEPEPARYGGAVGTRLAEDVFDATSRAALDLLRKVPSGDRAKRLGKALLAQLVQLHTFDPDRERAGALALRFGEASTRLRAGDAERIARWTTEHQRGFDRQSDQLAPYVEAAWSALEAGEPTTPELDALRRRLVGCRDALRDAATAGRLDGLADWPVAVRHLLPSILHMTNNRLGIDLREECYLAVVVASTLSDASKLAGSAGAAERQRAPSQPLARPAGGAEPDRRPA